MVRFAFFFVAVGLALTLSNSVMAEDEKEMTLEGTVCCAKCELKKSDSCATVIKAKNKKGEEVIYWFDTDSSKKYHKEICTETKDGTVKGKIKKDGDKMIVTVTEVKFK